MGLEETKQEIINSKARVINVWAGPGSGKSYLVAQMIRSLFEKETYESKRNKLSENILSLTFTNKASLELHRKIKKALSGDYRCPVTTTFHKYALELLKESESNEFANDVFDGTDSDNTCVFDKILDDATSFLNKNEIKDDKKIKYLFLDEAQDITPDIFEFIKAIMRANRNVDYDEDVKVIILSDIDQAIFGYNESDAGYIRDLMMYNPKNDTEFEDEPSDVEEYCLSGNYRSHQNIIDYTEKYRRQYPNVFLPRNNNTVIESKADIEDEGIVKCFISEDYCDAIIGTLRKDIGSVNEKPEHIGVILPYNDDVERVLCSLRSIYIERKNDIEIISTGKRREKGKNPFNTFPLEQLDEFYALIKNLRIARRVYGSSYKWGNGCIYYNRENSPEPQLYYNRDKKPCYEARNKCRTARNEYNFIECLNRFSSSYKNSKYYSAVCAFVDDYVNESGDTKYFNVDDFINWVSLYGFDDFYEEYVNRTETEGALIRITVSTIHKAKGMEFDSVYMACPDNVTLSDIEKCRYVAMTRTKQNLYIFNDKEVKGYCEKAQKIELNPKDVTSMDDHLLLTPQDLTISFLEYLRYGSYEFSQFIPCMQESDEQIFFPDTPDWAQADDDNLLLLDEDSSESNTPRWMITNSSGNLWIERLSNGENGGRKRYMEFADKCPDGYKVGIRIGVVMVYKGVLAPFHEDNWPVEQYKCLQSQHPYYYVAASSYGYNPTESVKGILITTVGMTNVLHGMNYYSIDGKKYPSEKSYEWSISGDGMLYEIDENRNRIPVNMEEVNKKLYDKKLILPELFYYKE
ncbi:MAG: AAA family ATPase [Lachnospiraceae bacterium]|nr:AAA family ATPase [Lachnospiraceae bacterium]